MSHPFVFVSLKTNFIHQNKRLSKGKKGIKKKVIDPFPGGSVNTIPQQFQKSLNSHSVDWHDIKAPSVFVVSDVGKAPAKESQGPSACPSLLPFTVAQTVRTI